MDHESADKLNEEPKEKMNAMLTGDLLIVNPAEAFSDLDVFRDFIDDHMEEEHYVCSGKMYDVRNELAFSTIAIYGPALYHRMGLLVQAERHLYFLPQELRDIILAYLELDIPRCERRYNFHDYLL